MIVLKVTKSKKKHKALMNCHVFAIRTYVQSKNKMQIRLRCAAPATPNQVHGRKNCRILYMPWD